MRVSAIEKDVARLSTKSLIELLRLLGAGLTLDFADTLMHSATKPIDSAERDAGTRAVANPEPLAAANGEAASTLRTQRAQRMDERGDGRNVESHVRRRGTVFI